MSIDYQGMGKKLGEVVATVIVAVSVAILSGNAVGEGFKAAGDAMKNV